MRPSNRRILCVDDDEEVRILLESYLTHSGLEVVVVKDLGAALRMMEREQFSLYVLDGGMPGVSGLSICEEIRKRDRLTPIVIFSGHGFASDIVAGMDAGANAYIVKPGVENLVPIVRRLLQ